MKENLDQVFIVIPAHNEEHRISKVIRKCLELGFKNLVVVNDASTDKTKSVAITFSGVVVLNHLINLGPGGATQTGIDYSVANGAKYIATIDADFQHDPNDLVQLYSKITSANLDLVIGSRFLQKNTIPFKRIVYNKFGNIITYLLSGISTTDSQSGLKILKSSLAKEIKLECNGFEFCIELIKIANSLNAKIAEIPINVKYTRDTMKKGQNLSSGFSMLSRLFSPFN